MIQAVSSFDSAIDKLKKSMKKDQVGRLTLEQVWMAADSGGFWRKFGGELADSD